MVRAADPDMRWQVTEILDTAKSMGLKVIRTWAFSDGPLQYNALQRYPGAPCTHRSPLVHCCSGCAEQASLHLCTYLWSAAVQCRGHVDCALCAERSHQS